MRNTQQVAAVFARPLEGLAYYGAIGWRSQGGAGDRHPDRALPVSLEVVVPPGEGRLACVSLVGVFAVHGGAESSGSVAATLLLQHGGEVVHRHDIVQGRHFGDAQCGTEVYRLNGDGSSVETVGQAEGYRVDKVTLDVPGGVSFDRVVLRDLGTPASFVVFEVLFDFETVAVCPFKGEDGRVALNEIGSILRLRDRARLDKALYQLSEGIHQCGSDIDEARGLALTFVGAVVSALLELDPQRRLHKEQLESARELETLTDARSIGRATVERVRRLTDAVVQRASRTGDALIDRALEVMSRNFAGDLDADALARDLGLSTSHFRHLFREATRQPFHKYLVSMRLEKARELLLQTEIPVTDVAEAVGFVNPAHFSRAFNKRFGIAPSALRQVRR
jgi:AraC-like DNA-binding protein